MKVQILTSQNVEIEYEIASIGERMGAVLIDLLIKIGYALAAFFVILLIEDALGIPDGFAMAFIILLYIPLFLYDLLCETFLDGQTFGKKAVKIKVVKLDGSQPSLGSYLLRWLIALVEKPPLMMGTIGLVAILLNSKGQRLGDMAAGTTVVKVKPAVTLDDTIFAEVEETYIPTFPSVIRLSDNDIALIQEVLNSREQMENPVVVGRLTSKVKEVTEVEPTMPNVQFLQTVVKDYNYYTSRI